VCANINEQSAREFLKENNVADFKNIAGVSSSCYKCMRTVKELHKEMARGCAREIEQIYPGFYLLTVGKEYKN